MQRINNQWTKPCLLDLFNDSFKIWSDGPMFFPGTNKLFFNTPREKSDSTNAWLDITNRIWTAEIFEGKWSEPGMRSVSSTQDINTVSMSHPKRYLLKLVNRFKTGLLLLHPMRAI